MVRERLAFADHLQLLRAEQDEDRRIRWEEVVGLHDEMGRHQEDIAWRTGEMERLEGEIARLEKELGETRASLDLVLNSRTFRYTAPIRKAYGTLRRWFRR